MKRRSTYINIRTYLSYSLRLQLIWNYTFLPFSLSLPLVYFVIQLFIYLVMLIFILCIYFLTFIFYINWCQSPVSPRHCGRCGDGRSVYVYLVGVWGRWCICLWGRGLVLNLWVWTVCSKISFIGKSFVVIEVLFLSFIWV